MNNALDVLKGAKLVLETQGWRREGYGHVGAPVCMVGAIRCAMFGDPQHAPEPYTAEEALHENCCHLLEDHLDTSVVDFNDYVAETKDEVLAVFDRAIHASLPAFDRIEAGPMP